MYKLREGIAFKAVAVTPSDTVSFPDGAASGGIYVGGTGDVVAIVAGVAVTYKAVPVGTVLRIAATRINATNTTATFLVAQY